MIANSNDSVSGTRQENDVRPARFPCGFGGTHYTRWVHLAGTVTRMAIEVCHSDDMSVRGWGHRVG